MLGLLVSFWVPETMGRTLEGINEEPGRYNKVATPLAVP